MLLFPTQQSRLHMVDFLAQTTPAGHSNRVGGLKT